MKIYSLVVFIHIVAATLLVGASLLAAPAIGAAIRRAGTTQEIRALLRLGRPLGTLNPLSAFIVLASGVFLAAATRFWMFAWVQVAVLFWLVNAVIAASLVKPPMQALADSVMAGPDGPVDARTDALRRSKRWSFGGDVLMANDVAMVFLMTVRPGLAGSLAAVIVTNAFVLAARLVLERSGAASIARAAGV